MTPSADLMLLRSGGTPAGHTSSELMRTMTPGPADFNRSTMTAMTGALSLKTAALRRESAPAEVFATHASVPHPPITIGPNSGTT